MLSGFAIEQRLQPHTRSFSFSLFLSLFFPIPAYFTEVRVVKAEPSLYVGNTSVYTNCILSRLESSSCPLNVESMRALHVHDEELHQDGLKQGQITT